MHDDNVNGRGATEVSRWEMFTEEERAVAMLGLTGASMTALQMEGQEGAARVFEVATQLAAEVSESMSVEAPSPLLVADTLALMRKDEQRPEPTDPSEASGEYEPEPGASIDTSRAVLFDDLWATVMRGDEGGEVKVGLQAGGRVNNSENRASILYVMDPDDVAMVATALLRVVKELGPAAEKDLFDLLDQL